MSEDRRPQDYAAMAEELRKVTAERDAYATARIKPPRRPVTWPSPLRWLRRNYGLVIAVTLLGSIVSGVLYLGTRTIRYRRHATLCYVVTFHGEATNPWDGHYHIETRAVDDPGNYGSITSETQYTSAEAARTAIEAHHLKMCP